MTWSVVFEIYPLLNFYSPYQDPKDYTNKALPLKSPGPNRKKSTVFRVDSHNDREEISPSSPADAVEYFFASDASAIIEHTDRYTYFWNSIIYFIFF